jgi:hypothetical protein
MDKENLLKISNSGKKQRKSSGISTMPQVYKNPNNKMDYMLPFISPVPNICMTFG